MELVPLPLTEDTVGSVAHVPVDKSTSSAPIATASEKVRLIDVGTEPNVVPLLGLLLESVGPVLSTVIVELSAETVELLPTLSCSVPAFTCTVNVPLPEQLLSVIVAPEVAIELTATVHEGLPDTVVTVTPPPMEVSVPESTDPPEELAV
jgi:hypothetical protein